MARDYIQWWEVTADYIEVKFVDTLDTTTLNNHNIYLLTDEATPSVVPDAFKTINVPTDYSSISRILTIYWDSYPITGSYYVNFNGLENFFGNSLEEFSFQFDWVADTATPNEDLRPTREPAEVEDYSIKTPGWSVVDSGTTVTSSTIDIIDIAPGVSIHHNVSVQENEGKIDVLFSAPVATNYITPLYFSLSSKPVQKGLSTWEAMDTYVTSNVDNTIISVYLPAVETVESATPVDPEYAYLKTSEELEGLVFFEPQTKYRLIISTDVGTP